MDNSIHLGHNNYISSIQCTGDIPILMCRFWHSKHKYTHSLPSQLQQATDETLKAWWGSSLPGLQLLNSMFFINFEKLSLALVGLGGTWKSTVHIPQYFLAPLQISTEKLQRWNIHGCYFVAIIKQNPSPFWKLCSCLEYILVLLWYIMHYYYGIIPQMPLKKINSYV